jgi:antitoxin PrlF
MQAGDRITFTLMPDGTVIMRAKTRRVTDLAGILYKKGRRRVSIDAMSR